MDGMARALARTSQASIWMDVFVGGPTIFVKMGCGNMKGGDVVDMVKDNLNRSDCKKDN